MSNNWYFIWFGNQTTRLLPFHNQISLQTIEQDAYREFGGNLPTAMRFKFYSGRTRDFLYLNDELLTSLDNPFAKDIPPVNTDTGRVLDYIQLFIVDDSSSVPTINLPLITPSNNISDQHGVISSTVSKNPSQRYVAENVPTIGIASGVSGSEDEGFISDEKFQELLQLINDDSNRSKTLDGDDSNLPKTLDEDPNDPIVNLKFAHDVQAYQKDNYLTNTFPVDPSTSHNTAKKTKTGIARIQGTKTEAQERIHVSPKISGLNQIKNRSNMKMYLYGVHETVSKTGEHRIWHVHRDKKFLLLNELERDAIPRNPIELNLNEITITDAGEFELNIYMFTKWEKSKTEKELYQLGEARILQLNSAPRPLQKSKTHIPPVRLLLLVKHPGSSTWKAIALSNFIQRVKDSPEEKRSIGKTVETDQQTSSKRKKT